LNLNKEDMKPDYKNIRLKELATEKATTSKPESQEPWMTAEQIPVKPVFTKADLDSMEHLSYAAGIPPYLRGPYSAMYCMQPWTVR